jgi:ParB/RepB/Spo0J family partition protein
LTILTPLVLEHEPLLRRFAQAPAKPLPATKKDLAAELGRDPSNLNKTLKLLEAEGLTYPGGGFGVAEDMGITEKGREALAALDRANDVRGAAMTGDAPEGFVWLTHAEIRPDPNNARKLFDEESLGELADSMAAKGLLQKPAVRLIDGEAGAQLVAGERRWRAWGLLIERGDWPADHRELCAVVEGDDAHADEAGLIENLQRADLKPLEEARGFKRLMDVHGHTTATIAEKVRFTQRFVQQRLQLLDLKPRDMEALEEGKINIEEARRRIANYPKPLELTPEQLLVFLETADRHARLGLDIGYGYPAPVHYSATEDEVWKAFAHNLFYPRTDYETDQVQVTLNSGAAAHALVQYTGVDSPEVDAIAEPLAKVREALGVQPASEGAYVTAWLNEPYDIDPEKVAENARIAAENEEYERTQKEKEGERLAAAKKADEADEAILAAVKALEADAPELDEQALRARFAALLTDHDRPAPWAIQYDRTNRGQLEAMIHYANGEPNTARPVALEAVRRLMTIAVNLACGLPATSGPYEPPAEAGDLTRTDFEAAMGARLKEHYEDEPEADCADRAKRLLAEFLDDNHIAYGDEGMRWDKDAAEELADQLDAEDMSDVLAEEPAGEPAPASEATDDTELPESLTRLAGVPAEVDS